MGLLDGLSFDKLITNLQDPVNQGLLAAADYYSTPQATKPTFFGGVNVMAQRIAELKKAKQQEDMQKLLMQQHQVTLAQALKAQGDQAEQQRFLSRAGDYFQSPQSQAIGMGGPTPEAAALIPQLQPKFDVQRFAVDALRVPGMQSQALGMLQKDETPITLADGAKLVSRQGKEIASNPKMQTPHNGYLVPDGRGGWKIDPGLYAAELQLKATGATKVNVPVTMSTEKKYGEQFAGKVAESDSAMLDAATKSPELADRSNRIKQVLASGKVITGYGADYRLALGKALGLGGASDGETIQNTETLSADLARNTLDAIKASGLGSGNGFSNADRDFLNKAAGGLITFEAGTLSRLADLSHRAATLSADKWNKRVKMIPGTALDGTGVSRDPIAVAPLFGNLGGNNDPKTAIPLPKPSQDLTAVDLTRGQLYDTPRGAAVWDGFMFRKVQP